MTVHEDKATDGATEVEQLRAEVARLQAEVDSGRPDEPETAPHRSGRWRWVGVGVLLLLVALLAQLAVVATWVHDEISDTNRYVETVTPLASDPAVQDAAIARVTNEIYSRLDVKGVTKEAVDAWSEILLPLIGVGGDDTCTPSYLNNEGHPIQLKVGFEHPDGSEGFFKFMEEWRRSGTFDGLSFS